jgi:hypothetical protein
MSVREDLFVVRVVHEALDQVVHLPSVHLRAATLHGSVTAVHILAAC